MSEPVATAGPTRVVALDLLRICAVVGVVAIHVFGAIVSDADRSGTPGWWLAVVLDLGNVWVVPVFVMVSGALLLGGRAQKAGPASFYRKRLLRLGPAFVFWQVFYVVVVRWLLSDQQLSLGSVAGMVIDGRTYTHLYFLWLIAGLYVIAPVLAAFLAGGGPRRAVIFAACVLAATVVTYSASGLMGWAGQPRPIILTALTQWIPYVGYFLAGWALRALAPRGWAAVAIWVLTALALAEIVWQYGVRPDFPLLQAAAPVSYLGPVVALASIGVFLSFSALFARVQLPPRILAFVRELSDAAFGVFLVHFALIVALRAIPGFGPRTISSLPVAILLWVTVVVLSFVISIACRRIPYVRRIF